MRHILQSSWYQSLYDQEKRLVENAIQLYEREYELDSELKDYSFIVFPISKAYEGFLKRRFFDFKLIERKTYEGGRFRIGKALNPDVTERSRDKYWLFDDLSQLCGNQLARELWDTWLVCRNHVFHFYPLSDNSLSLESAGNYLLRVSNAMRTLIECQTELQHQKKSEITL